jgi:hypothetical protein
MNVCTYASLPFDVLRPPLLRTPKCHRRTIASSRSTHAHSRWPFNNEDPTPARRSLLFTEFPYAAAGPRVFSSRSGPIVARRHIFVYRRVRDRHSFHLLVPLSSCARQMIGIVITIVWRRKLSGSRMIFRLYLA